MRILIACEFSGIVREAFAKRGHDVWSCDLLDTEISGNHLKMDIIKEQVIEDGRMVCGVMGWLYYPWDLVIAFPPCTDLAVSGARWFKDKNQQPAIDFFNHFVNANVPRIAIENPIGIMSTKYRKPDQIIQPWQFGHGETKATCLWLKNLPKLQPTNIVNGREARIHRMPPGPDRWKERSRTFQGIADAMASQWGELST